MKKIISIIFSMIIVLGISGQSYAEDYNIDKVISDTASYIYQTIDTPQVSSVGGEWAILGLARSGIDIPKEYYEKYYANLEEYLKNKNGILHSKKYTEYSRVIIALTSIGKNPENVAGYNLLLPLADYEKTIWQGINGPIWALIALDSGNYEIPQNPQAKTQATREMYINRILECQLSDGGWSLTSSKDINSKSDADVTGMAIQALAKYQDSERVNTAINKALDCMSRNQDNEGGFSSWGTANSESCVQMIVALCELGIPIDDLRFVKNNNTILDNLMNYYEDGKGFKHTLDEQKVNLMATEQGLYGIVAAKRIRDGESSLYRMSDSNDTNKVIEILNAENILVVIKFLMCVI